MMTEYMNTYLEGLTNGYISRKGAVNGNTCLNKTCLCILRSSLLIEASSCGICGGLKK